MLMSTIYMLVCKDYGSLDTSLVHIELLTGGGVYAIAPEPFRSVWYG